MTELLIVSKPRGRIFKWIYGQYKEYLSPISFDKGSFTNPLTVNATGTDLLTGGKNYAKYKRAQRFKTPNIFPDGNKITLVKVVIRLKQLNGLLTGSIAIQLWSDDNGSPGTKLADLGTLNAEDLTTSYQDFEISCSVELDPNTHYWIYVDCSDAWDDRIDWDGSSDVYTDGYTWNNDTGNETDKDAYLEVHYQSPKFTINLDFIYSGAAEKRLEITFSGSQTVDDITVNGQSVGTDLLKDDSIPQADNYSIVLTVSAGDVSGSIQRWLYFNKTSITLDDLAVSEAYIQEIDYGSDGGVLRIDDDPAGDLVGSADEKIQFTDILVPFRKLEWISGGGEVLILGVE